MFISVYDKWLLKSSNFYASCGLIVHPNNKLSWLKCLCNSAKCNLCVLDPKLKQILCCQDYMLIDFRILFCLCISTSPVFLHISFYPGSIILCYILLYNSLCSYALNHYLFLNSSECNRYIFGTYLTWSYGKTIYGKTYKTKYR